MFKHQARKFGPLKFGASLELGAWNLDVPIGRAAREWRENYRGIDSRPLINLSDEWFEHPLQVQLGHHFAKILKIDWLYDTRAGAEPLAFHGVPAAAGRRQGNDRNCACHRVFAYVFQHFKSIHPGQI